MRHFLSITALCVFCMISSAQEKIWTLGAGLENWKALYRLKCTPGTDGLHLTQIGYDSAIQFSPLRLDPAKLNVVEITYKATGIRPRTNGQIYFKDAVEFQNGK